MFFSTSDGLPVCTRKHAAVGGQLWSSSVTTEACSLVEKGYKLAAQHLCVCLLEHKL